MKRLLFFTLLISIVEMTSIAQIQETGWLSEGFYITTSRQGRVIGDTVALGGYTLVQYTVNEGDDYTISFEGNSVCNSTVVAAAWYSSTVPSSETYIAPALLNNGVAMEAKDADGDYEITAPEGAVMLAASCARYYADALLYRSDGTRVPIISTDEKHAPEEYLSGTLPVLYINTQYSEAIVSKNYYIAGTYYLDNLGLEGFESIGSKEEPLSLQIKGRGNASWKDEKKPYRIKLDKKQPLMGLTKSKHFCLMAHASNGSGYQHDEMGFTLSQEMGLEYSPQQRPIELVVNGDYLGIYWVAEKIRVENNRVNIVEQADYETDPLLITGGWLIEFDNYPDPNQINFTEGNGSLLRVTYHTPEALSEQQYNYLSNFIATCDSLIYLEDKNSREWERYIDIDELAKFYVLHEIIDNCEAFSGSCFWHKDIGEDTKLIVGPVWDCGNVASHSRINNYNYFIYQQTQVYIKNHWIEEICKFPHFQQKVREVWQDTYPEKVEAVKQHCLDYVDYIIPAVAQDFERWHNSNSNYMSYRKYRVWEQLRLKWDFLERKWNNTMYVLGQLYGDDWNPASGVEMQTNDGLYYTAYVTVKQPAHSLNSGGYAYFNFSSRLADTSDNWDEIKQYRYGAVNDSSQGDGDVYISSDLFGQELPIEESESPHAFALPAGNYMFTLDRFNMKFSATPVSPTFVEGINHSQEVKSVSYYNVQGVMSATPFEGFNIVVKVMSDGTKITSKVMK